MVTKGASPVEAMISMDDIYSSDHVFYLNVLRESCNNKESE